MLACRRLPMRPLKTRYLSLLMMAALLATSALASAGYSVVTPGLDAGPAHLDAIKVTIEWL